MPEPGEFLTVSEVAAMLKLNQQTVRNWIDPGKLPYVRVGRLIEQGYSGAPSASPPAARPGVWKGEIQPPDTAGSWSGAGFYGRSHHRDLGLRGGCRVRSGT